MRVCDSENQSPSLLPSLSLSLPLSLPSFIEELIAEIKNDIAIARDKLECSEMVALAEELSVHFMSNGHIA